VHHRQLVGPDRGHLTFHLIQLYQLLRFVRSLSVVTLAMVTVGLMERSLCMEELRLEIQLDAKHRIGVHCDREARPIPLPEED